MKKFLENIKKELLKNGIKVNESLDAVNKREINITIKIKDVGECTVFESEVEMDGMTFRDIKDALKFLKKVIIPDLLRK